MKEAFKQAIKSMPIVKDFDFGYKAEIKEEKKRLREATLRQRRLVKLKSKKHNEHNFKY